MEVPVSVKVYTDADFESDDEGERGTVVPASAWTLADCPELRQESGLTVLIQRKNKSFEVVLTEQALRDALLAIEEFREQQEGEVDLRCENLTCPLCYTR